MGVVGRSDPPPITTFLDVKGPIAWWALALCGADRADPAAVCGADFADPAVPCSSVDPHDPVDYADPGHDWAAAGFPVVFGYPFVNLHELESDRVRFVAGWSGVVTVSRFCPLAYAWGYFDFVIRRAQSPVPGGGVDVQEFVSTFNAGSGIFAPVAAFHHTASYRPGCNWAVTTPPAGR